MSRPEFQRVTLGTMTSRDEGFLALLPFARTSSSIQGREGECSGRSRRRKRKLRGCCGSWKGGMANKWAKGRDGSKDLCAHVCESTQAFTPTLFTSFVIKTEESSDFNGTFYIYIYMYSRKFLFNEISFWKRVK